jgi:hypothetical protein
MSSTEYGLRYSFCSESCAKSFVGTDGIFKKARIDLESVGLELRIAKDQVAHLESEKLRLERIISRAPNAKRED